MELKKYIRDVPDFPKKGIVFKDITTLLKEPKAFKTAIDMLYEKFKNRGIKKVVAVESRGFIFGAALAYKLNAGIVPVRKKGKLPYKTAYINYELEYGVDTLEVHVDGIESGEKVLVVDDVLATGGTANAVCELVEKLKGVVAGCVFLIELKFLKGREKLKKYKVYSLITYS